MACEFDFGSGELRRNGRTVAPQTQPAQILASLLSRPGELVTRGDLCRAIWADDTFVEFDTGLDVAINKVRQALGDSAAAPRFIETLPKRGYGFLADVREVDQRESSETCRMRRRLPPCSRFQGADGLWQARVSSQGR